MDLRHESDVQLVRQAKDGEFDAFEELVNRHEGRLYTLAMRITGRRHDAEDVVGSTFLSVLEHLADFREEAAFGTWAGKIATNHALKVLRKRRGEAKGWTADRDGDNGGRLEEMIADWREDAEAKIARKELKHVLEQAVEGLSEKLRVVFVLRDMEGMSVKETAQTMGISESDVKVSLMRARMELRERLTDIFGDDRKRMKRPALLGAFMRGDGMGAVTDSNDAPENRSHGDGM